MINPLGMLSRPAEKQQANIHREPGFGAFCNNKHPPSTISVDCPIASFLVGWVQSCLVTEGEVLCQRRTVLPGSDMYWVLCANAWTSTWTYLLNFGVL